MCRIFDFGVHEADGSDEPSLPFLTMELLIGLTLQARLRERGPLTAAETLDVSQQLAAGLQAAHLVHVIHKDLKAENVILIELAGTACAPSSRTSVWRRRSPLSMTVLTAGPGFSGTPGHVAPERLAGAPVTEANDVYALGMVMLDMLDGHAPPRPRARTRRCAQLAGSGAIARAVATLPGDQSGPAPVAR